MWVDTPLSQRPDAVEAKFTHTHNNHPTTKGLAKSNSVHLFYGIVCWNDRVSQHHELGVPLTDMKMGGSATDPIPHHQKLTAR